MTKFNLQLYSEIDRVPNVNVSVNHTNLVAIANTLATDVSAPKWLKLMQFIDLMRVHVVELMHVHVVDLTGGHVVDWTG